MVNVQCKSLFYRSNINDWYQCKPNGGSLVRQKNGSIFCNHTKETTNCGSTVIPEIVEWEKSGPVLRGSGNIAVYRFDGSTSNWYPTHNSCKNGTKNHKRGVANPYGQIFVR